MLDEAKIRCILLMTVTMKMATMKTVMVEVKKVTTTMATATMATLLKQAAAVNCCVVIVIVANHWHGQGCINNGNAAVVLRCSQEAR